ncbi:hypothetical protein [Pseudomonas sp. PS01299]|jgi:hypothetical protein|nr:hypothetical protein [Pseudomonas sp. PS01299]
MEIFLLKAVAISESGAAPSGAARKKKAPVFSTGAAVYGKA